MIVGANSNDAGLNTTGSGRVVVLVVGGVVGRVVVTLGTVGRVVTVGGRVVTVGGRVVTVGLIVVVVVLLVVVVVVVVLVVVDGATPVAVISMVNSVAGVPPVNRTSPVSGPSTSAPTETSTVHDTPGWSTPEQVVATSWNGASTVTASTGIPAEPVLVNVAVPVADPGTSIAPRSIATPLASSSRSRSQTWVPAWNRSSSVSATPSALSNTTDRPCSDTTGPLTDSDVVAGSSSGVPTTTSRVTDPNGSPSLHRIDWMTPPRS